MGRVGYAAIQLAHFLRRSYGLHGLPPEYIGFLRHSRFRSIEVEWKRWRFYLQEHQNNGIPLIDHVQDTTVKQA